MYNNIPSGSKTPIATAYSNAYEKPLALETNTFNLMKGFFEAKGFDKTSAESIDAPSPLICDITHFINVMLFNIVNREEASTSYQESLISNYILCVQEFLRGYVAMFPQDRRAELCAHMSEIIQLWMHTAATLCHEDRQESRIAMIGKLFYASDLISKKRPPVGYPSVYCKQEQGLWKGFVDSLSGKDDCGLQLMFVDQYLILC